MPLATEVTLPKGVKPVFPDKCIVCHAKPDSSTKIAQNSQNWVLAFFLPIVLFFGWSRVEIPICKKCKGTFRMQRWGRQLLGTAIIIIAVWLIMPHFKGWVPIVRKIAVAALVLLGLSPFIFAEVFWPRVFNTTAQGDTVDYEFASEEYAMAFLGLNAEHAHSLDLNS